MRPAAVALVTALAAFSGAASAQTAKPAPAEAPAAAPAAAPASEPSPSAAALSPADASAKAEAEMAASRKAVQDLEAQVIELRRIIEAFDRSRASVGDLRRRLDEMEARLRENDRRDDALATGAGGETSVFKFRDEGYAMRSPNGHFLLVPHLRLQTVWEGGLASQGTMDTAPPDTSGFALTHAELILDGHVGGRQFMYRLQLDAAESPALNDAYMQVAFTRSVGVRVGRFKVPYGLQRRIYSGDLEFINISAPMAAFSLERDIGLMAIGRPLAGRLQYEFAVLNGADGQLNDNIDLAYAARVAAAPWGPLPAGEGDIEWHPEPRAMMGIAGYYNLIPTDVIARTGDPMVDTDQDNDGRIDNVAVWQGNVELKALWRGAALQAEWFGRTETPGGIYPSRSYQGAYVQASYFIIRGRLQVAGRLGQTEVPRYKSTPAERARLGTEVSEQSVGINAYLHGSHRMKLQVDYTHLHFEDATTGLDAGSGPEVHRLRAAVQLGF
jgi:molybdopterin converting factor small subunit